jgi:hypothetical protein
MTQRPRATVHRIVEVHFQRNAEQGRPSSEAPILCSCGEVTRSGTWETHRGITLASLKKRESAERLAA